MTESMVEKIARGQAEFDGRPWLSMPKTERERYMDRARAALQAIRDPTKEMAAAGREAYADHVDQVSTHMVVEQTFTAMIDRALKENAE